MTKPKKMTQTERRPPVLAVLLKTGTWYVYRNLHVDVVDSMTSHMDTIQYHVTFTSIKSEVAAHEDPSAVCPRDASEILLRLKQVRSATPMAGWRPSSSRPKGISGTPSIICSPQRNNKIMKKSIQVVSNQ